MLIELKHRKNISSLAIKIALNAMEVHWKELPIFCSTLGCLRTQLFLTEKQLMIMEKTESLQNVQQPKLFQILLLLNHQIKDTGSNIIIKVEIA